MGEEWDGVVASEAPDRSKVQVDTTGDKCCIHLAALKTEAAMFTFIVSPVVSAHQSHNSRED